MHLLREGEAVTDLLAPYRSVVRAPVGDRCWVLANMVGGLDGTASMGGRVGALSHGTDLDLFRLMRALADVVLVGAETVRREGYGPVVLPGGERAAREAAGRSPVPPLAIVSRSLRLDFASRAFTDAPPDARTIVVTSAAADPAGVAAAGEVADVLVAGDDSVDLRAALVALHAAGHDVVLCEGGPTLLGLLAAGGLLDELCLTVSPLMGGDPLPLAVTPAGAGTTSFELRHVAADGDTLFLRYETAAHVE